MTTDVNETRQTLRDDVVTLRQRIGSELDTLGEGIVGESTHVNDTDNPHEVTPYHLGLGYLENYPVATLGEVSIGGLAAAYIKVGHLPQAVSVHLPQSPASTDVRAPLIQQPLIDEVGVSTTLTVTAVEFSATLRTPLTHIEREYQVISSSGNWGSPLTEWSQGDDGPSTCPIALSSGQTYQLRARDHGSSGRRSEWSLPISFTTA